MAGSKKPATKLNATLLKIVLLLIGNNINNWFISYGTLLGLIRNNSCIEGDDDVDIMCNISDYDIIKNILIKNNFSLCYDYGINDNKNIIKTNETDEYSTIDIYMATVDNKGNYDDTWNHVIWMNCHNANGKLPSYLWNNIVVNIPNDHKIKLAGRYGNDWMIPQDIKQKGDHKIL
jgi:hypothetical protein